MKTKPFTSAQLEKIQESWDALMGIGTYTRATDAEPNEEQLIKIQEAYNRPKLLEILNSEVKLTLFDKYLRQLIELGIAEEFSGVPFRQFENEAWSETHLKNPPPRKRKKLSPFEKLADQFSAALSNAKKFVPVSDPKKLKLFNDVVYKFVTEQTLLDLRSVELAKSNGLPMTEVCRYMKKAFMEAIDRGDTHFFTEVGRVLTKRQLKPNYWEKHSGGPDTLDIFLCVHWVKEFEGVKPLFNLSMKEVAAICELKVPEVPATYIAIEKRRQRLGLLRLKK